MTTAADVLSGSAKWCLLTGDCREVLPTLPDRSVGHAMTDPPYSRDLYLRFRTNKGARRDLEQQTVNHLALASLRIGAAEDTAASVAPELLRVARRWIVLFHDAESGHLWREPFGRAHVRCGVWIKPNAVPQISGDRPGQGFESIEIAHRPGRKKWNGGGFPAVWTHLNVNANPLHGERGTGHPCPKPLSLMLELVELFTDPDEVVLDPFAGSGTTGVACLRLGRRFIGIEKDAGFAQVATERLQAESQGLTLRAARAGQLPLFVGGAK